VASLTRFARLNLSSMLPVRRLDGPTLAVERRRVCPGPDRAAACRVLVRIRGRSDVIMRATAWLDT